MFLTRRSCNVAELVFDGEHVQVLADQRGGDTLLITFNEMEMSANGRSYWGEVPVRNLGLSCIGFMSKRKNWFPEMEMTQACAAVATIISGYRAVATYGFSQGGYAAIKYSRKLSATSVLAFSPQFTINPAICATYDRRFTSNFSEALHAGMEITRNDVSGVIRVFVDPYEVGDAFQSRLINAILDYDCIVPCFNLGHGTVRAVASAPAMEGLIQTCFKKDGEKELYFDLIRRQKKLTFAYFFALGQRAIRRNHMKIATYLYLKAHSLNPAHPYLKAWEAALAARFGLAAPLSGAVTT